MQGDKTLKEHEKLMGRMAQTLGADLDEAELRGDLPPEERCFCLARDAPIPKGARNGWTNTPRPRPRPAIAATANVLQSLRASTDGRRAGGIR